MKILTFVNYYLPGFRGGGPIRSIANLVAHLGREYEFRIVTTDRDFADEHTYDGVDAEKWQKVGDAEVCYMRKERINPWVVRKLLANSNCDVIYLNSFFHPRFTIQILLLRYLGLVPRIPAVLAPRGELSAGALALKKWKKRAFVVLARALGLYDRVLWQASSAHEEAEIRAIFGGSAKIDRVPVLVVPDMAALNDDVASPIRTPKAVGTLRIAFLSRITRKKNLDGAIRMLGLGLRGNVEFTIYGAIDDQSYWEECQKQLRALPEGIRVRYAGPIAHSSVQGELTRSDLFFFPTHGENFGHVILEALLAGCSVLTSDRTPWLDLEARGVGWSLPLDRADQFAAALQHMIDLPPEECAARSRRAVQYGFQVSHDPLVRRKNRELFEHAVALQEGA